MTQQRIGKYKAIIDEITRKMEESDGEFANCLNCMDDNKKWFLPLLQQHMEPEDVIMIEFAINSGQKNAHFSQYKMFGIYGHDDHFSLGCIYAEDFISGLIKLIETLENERFSRFKEEGSRVL